MLALSHRRWTGSFSVYHRRSLLQIGAAFGYERLNPDQRYFWLIETTQHAKTVGSCDLRVQIRVCNDPVRFEDMEDKNTIRS
jgi:hypothetical protein